MPVLDRRKYFRMILIMRNHPEHSSSCARRPTTRSRRKAESHQAIVAAASRLFRRNGIGAASVADVMTEAGLTHGGFYSHFADKNALAAEAFAHAARHRDRWFSGLDGADPKDWLARVTKRYLNRRHRDRPEDGCPFPALCHEMAALPKENRTAVDRAIEEAVRRMAPHLPPGIGPGGDQSAMALLSLFVGATLLSRAVASEQLADELLEAGRQFVLGEKQTTNDSGASGETP